MSEGTTLDLANQMFIDFFFESTAVETWCPKLILKQHFFCRGSDVTVFSISAAPALVCDVAYHPDWLHRRFV